MNSLDPSVSPTEALSGNIGCAANVLDGERLGTPQRSHDPCPSFFEVLQVRRSVRVFQARPVEDDKLQRILAAANRAPSAGNLQGYEIVVIRDEATKQALVKATYNQAFIAQAPVLLLFCSHPRRSAVKYGEEGGALFSLEDATIACAYAELATAALGLGTVWIGALDVPQVREITRISADWKPVALLPIGYRGETPAVTSRRPLADLVHELPLV